MSEIAVLGLGRFGSSLAISLEEMGNEVLGVDSNIDIVDDIAPLLTSALCMDLHDEKALQALALSDFDCVVIGIGTNTQSSIILSMMVKDMGAKKLICKAGNEMHARILEKIGVDGIVFPEQDSAYRLARTLTDNNVLDYMQLSAESIIMELIPHTDWLNRSLADLGFRNRYNVTVVAIRRGEEINLPSADEAIQKGDMLLVVGKNKDMDKLRQALV